MADFLKLFCFLQVGFERTFYAQPPACVTHFWIWLHVYPGVAYEQIPVRHLWFRCLYLTNGLSVWREICTGTALHHTTYQWANERNSRSQVTHAGTSSFHPVTWGTFIQHGLILIPTWISNHMQSKVWDEIIYPFLNFNGFIPHLLMDVTTYPCWDWS